MSALTNQIYPCTRCGKTYQRKNHLARHEATHGVSARYECDACHKTFSRRRVPLPTPAGEDMAADRRESSDVWRKHCSKCPQRNGGEAPPRLTRGRKPGACEHCFRSKVTCDRAEPCRRCQSRQLTCSYGRVRGGREDATSPQATPKPDSSRWKTGAMFLLSLTDPAAANMLESFTDDELSDITSDNASPVAVEEVPMLEDEIFLQSLCDFVFDPMPIDMDDIGRSATRTNGHHPIAPIFRSEAYPVLQAMAESTIRELKDLHCSLTVSDTSYSESFVDTSVNQAFSPESIIAFATAYFQLSHHHVPIVHRLSFGTSDTAPTLLLAVILAGALRSPPRDDALCIRSLSRLFEEYIFLRLEETMATYGPSASPLDSKRLLETLQAAILVNNVQFMVNEVVTRRRLRTRRLPVLVSTVRRLGPFSIRHSPNADGIQFLYEESCIRIAHWTAMADWHQSVLFHLPPLVSISELTGDMPDMTGAWDNDYVPLLGAEYEQPACSRAEGPRSMRGHIRILMQEHIPDVQFEALRGLSMLNLYLMILGLNSAIISANQMCTISTSAPAFDRALSRWQVMWKFAVANDLDACGIERYSDGQWWAARKILDALVSGDEQCPYLDQVGHETLTEIHAFLLRVHSPADEAVFIISTSGVCPPTTLLHLQVLIPNIHVIEAYTSPAGSVARISFIMPSNVGPDDPVFAAAATPFGPQDAEAAEVQGSGGANGDRSLDLNLEMLPIGSSDQACKECRRRKARCDKNLPTCSLCVRHRRHCLYEKHSRTPLTRKHLTEVEERLEKTEALVRRMRMLVPPNLRAWEREAHTASQVDVAETSFNFASTAGSEHGNTARTGEHSRQAATHEARSGEGSSSGPSTEAAMQPSTSDDFEDGVDNVLATQDQHDQQRMLEGPPLYDFEWCEKETGHIAGLSPEAVVDGTEEESPISDGMASLTVNEREGGYLGVASGAAMLRLLEPKARRRTSSRPQQATSMTPRITQTPMLSQPNPNRHIAEVMVDAYFRLYHVSYPIIHEPTFRAQYSEVIARPNGSCWTVLAYVVAAIGVWVSSTSSSNTLDLALFSQARSMLNFDYLELGNLTLVQALTLGSNYQQKRDKPNSGYNYLGLAVRMAMGLGLHKEFQGWNISPLTMEIRRRVWWTLCVFDVGATITFSRPDVWPYKGVEVSLPLNVNDKDLTAASQNYPAESIRITPYTAVTTQARFHIAAHECYEKIISRPFPSASTLLRLDAKHIEPWQSSVPPYFSEQTVVPPRYALSQAVMSWRVRNLRIIMYRPFVIRRALRRRADADEESGVAYTRCLAEAKATIEMIAEYWGRHEHNRLAAWYALYFLFQAALIPCICLRNEPSAQEAADWRTQITLTLRTISALASVNTTSERCHQVIMDLCGRYLDYRQAEHAVIPPLATADSAPDQTDAALGSGEVQFDAEVWMETQPVGESPQTQLHNVMNMMWPNVPPMEAADVVMGDEAGWMEFLAAGAGDMWDVPDS